MERLNTQQCLEMLLACRDILQLNAAYLCQLDSLVGDGDHGLTVSKGFDTACKKLLEKDCRTPYEVFNSFSKELGRAMGGAIGPIFQSIFLGMSNAIRGHEVILAADFLEMQRKGLQAVMVIGGAKVGDRTLVDAFAPAVESYAQAFSQGNHFADCMLSAAAAAKRGCEETANLIARKGRAKFLGEKSRGHQDAGATSMYLIYQAMCSYIRESGD